jgi:hypothetical protein
VQEWKQAKKVVALTLYLNKSAGIAVILVQDLKQLPKSSASILLSNILAVIPVSPVHP